jgi:hypothetical protein
MSCSKHKLTSFQKDFYNAYNKGDTLVFKSTITQKNNIFVITDKSNDVSFSFNSNMQGYSRGAEIKYKKIVSNNIDTVDFGSFASMGNNQFITGDVKLKFEGAFNIVNNFGDINNNDTIQFFSKKYIDYYIFTDSIHKTSFKINIVRIYWHKKYGIIKYDLKNGDSFIRINTQ